MIHTIRNFLDFSGEENKKKFVVSIHLGVLEALANALKVPAVLIILMGLLSKKMILPYIRASLLLMIVSVVISILTKMYISVLETQAGYGCCAYKRIEMAEHLRFVPMGYFNQNTTGEIASVITNTMDSLSNIATRVVMVTVQGILETVLVLIFLYIFDWRIGIVGTVGLVLFLMINTQLQKTGGKISEEKDKSDTEMVSQIMEYLNGIAEIKSYGLFGKTSHKFDMANEACRKANTDMEMKYQPWFLLQNLVIRLTSICIVMFSVLFYTQDTMSLIVTVGMVISAFIVFAGLETFGSFTSLLHLVQQYMDKANDVLETPVMDIDGKEMIPESENIDFEHVDFSYDEKPIICDVSVRIPENKTTAIVGPSGSGKTTLVHLAARFWDVNHGSVFLDGRNVKEYSFDSLMNNFSFVFQNVYLFHDTIENNIRFGRPEATHEEVVETAKKACCDEFISALPDGYDTVIGEGGSSLSGGEKQRISIARALMKDAPVIILDEATANVDPENEAELMKAIDSLTHEKTVIMIAHRLKTVKNADQIIVMDQGRIVDAGTHEELIQKDGIYRNFIEARKHAVNWQIH